MSAIDLSFSTPNIAQRLHWKVLPEIYNSDHLPIIIEILSNPDWSTFSSYLELELISNNPLNDLTSIDESITKFTNSVVLSAEKTIGYSSSYSKNPRVPWWNDEIKQQIKKRTKLSKLLLIPNHRKTLSNLKSSDLRPGILSKLLKPHTGTILLPIWEPKSILT